MTNAPSHAILGQRLDQVRARMTSAAQRAGRDPDTIHLLAVAKTYPAEAIRALTQAGQIRFAESYAQEAADKMNALADLDVEWHFVGPLQSNKAKLVAPSFHWVHSVDRIKTARALERHSTEGAPLNICLQVNVSGEASKAGCAPEDLGELAEAVAAECPRLRLRGLMAIPAPGADPEAVRPAFRRLAAIRAELAESGPEAPWDTLSMGMSHDFEVAIEEGATHVRVGSALFGERNHT